MPNRARSSTTPPSILKKPKNNKVRHKEIKQTPVKVRFVLPHAQKVQNILEDYVSTKQSRDYENILCLIRDAELSDEDVLSLLKEATECIRLLSKELKLFVESLLSIDWTNRRSNVVKDYQTFIVNLVAAHNYHAKLVIDKLVKLFLPGKLFIYVIFCSFRILNLLYEIINENMCGYNRNYITGPEDLEWPGGQPTDIDRHKCVNIHFLIQSILEIVPM